MSRRLAATLAGLRRFWTGQVHLHQLALDRYDVSGRDAVDAARSLRWVGPTLAGDLLPPAAAQGHQEASGA